MTADAAPHATADAHATYREVESALSWTEDVPYDSPSFAARANDESDDATTDVGGGASRLVNEWVARSARDITGSTYRERRVIRLAVEWTATGPYGSRTS